MEPTAAAPPRIAVAVVVALLSCVALALSAGAAASAPRAHVAHYACSGPTAATTPCHFSTPSGNIRCLWTPSPETVQCELLSSHLAYRMRPTGHAWRVHIALARRGETLPTSQQLVFPRSMSCQDTRVTMTCNQDFLLGAFKLAPHGSHFS